MYKLWYIEIYFFITIEQIFNVPIAFTTSQNSFLINFRIHTYDFIGIIQMSLLMRQIRMKWFVKMSFFVYEMSHLLIWSYNAIVYFARIPFLKFRSLKLVFLKTNKITLKQFLIISNVSLVMYNTQLQWKCISIHILKLYFLIKKWKNQNPSKEITMIYVLIFERNLRWFCVCRSYHSNNSISLRK